MKSIHYSLSCTCGWVNPPILYSDTDAEDAALQHLRTPHGPFECAVTCTRPAHFYPSSVPVIVFIARPSAKPPITRYAGK